KAIPHPFSPFYQQVSKMSSRNAVNRKATTMTDGPVQKKSTSTEEEKPSIPVDFYRVLPPEMVERVVVNLDGTTRLDLFLALGQPKNLEASLARTQKAIHGTCLLAIRESIVETAPSTGRFTRSQNTHQAIMVEFKLGDGVKQARRWKTPIAETATLLKAIRITTKLRKVCCQLDVTRTDPTLIEIIRKIECSTLKIEHQVAKSDIERRSGAKTADEAATLDLAFFMSNGAFSPSVTKLGINNIRFDEKDYALFLE
ncbi:hypothetical protein PMAYCL1PPCAC_19324, partial [Pristionchus mayeri]